MTSMHCTHCGGQGLAPGFIEDSGEHAKGHARWVEGVLELGFFGGAKRAGRTRWLIDAFRCKDCSHLELFARPNDR